MNNVENKSKENMHGESKPQNNSSTNTIKSIGSRTIAIAKNAAPVLITGAILLVAADSIASWLNSEQVKVTETKAVDHKRKDELCGSLSELAMTTMRARQRGVSMMVAMRAIGNSNIENEFVANATRAIVKMAYDHPRFETSDYQNEAVNDFGNKIALDCYKGW